MMLTCFAEELEVQTVFVCSKMKGLEAVFLPEKPMIDCNERLEKTVVTRNDCCSKDRNTRAVESVNAGES